MSTALFPAALFAVTLAGCPDWDAYTRGSPDAGTGTPTPGAEAGVDSGQDSSRDASAADASDATVDAAPSVTIDYESEPAKTYDLTALGPTDWMELHEKDVAQTNRCKPCTQVISSLATEEQLFIYGEDGRIFQWSNGTPAASGQSKGGVFVEGVGSSLQFEVTANGQRQLLTMHIDTYYAGANIVASMKGVAPVSKEVEKVTDQGRYAVRIHFVGAAGAKLAVSFTESAVLPVTIAGDKPNIAFNAVTLAPDN